MRLAAVAGNPVLVRHLATTFTGPRLGVAFLLLCGAMVLLYGGLFWVQTRERMPTGLVYVLHNIVLLGALIVLLPLKVTGLIEGPRLARALDQVVVTGISPGTLYRGAWLAGLCYAAVLLFVTVPFAACMVVFGGVEPARMLHGYGTLLLYSNVILAVSLAASVFAREWFATPMAVGSLAAVSAFSLIRNRDWLRVFHPVVAELSPVRMWMRQALDPDLHPATRLGDPVLLSWEVPVDVLWPVLWASVCGVGALLCAVGPGHVFSPGFDNFGAVVLPGDRRRGFVGLLRGAQTRRVEMGFLYENAAEWAKRWGAPLRTAMVALLVVLAWAAMAGAIHGAQPVPRNADFGRDGGAVGFVVGGGVVLALWCFGHCASRTSSDARQRFGPWRLSRGTVAWVVFPVLLGVLFLVEWLPGAAMQRPGAAVAVPAGWLDSWWRATPAMLLVAGNLFLLSRLACRVTDSEVRARVYCLLGFTVFLIVPSIVAAFAVSADTPAPRAWQALARLSPAVLVERTGVEGWGGATGFARFAAAQVVVAGLLLALLGAAWIARRLRRAPIAVVAALACGTTLGAQGGVEIVDVARGFDGAVFAAGIDFYTITLRNTGVGAVAVEYRVEDGDGRERGRGACTLGAQTTRTEHLALPASEVTHQATRVVVHAGSETFATDVLGVRSFEERAWGGAGRAYAVDPMLFVGARPTFPPEFGSRPGDVERSPELLTCRAASLPRSSCAYSGASIVWIATTDLSALRRDQRRALYDHLRLGGSVIFHGPLGEAELADADEFAALLRPEEQTRAEVDGKPLLCAELVEGRTLMALGSPPTPFLHGRRVGAGWLSHMACAPQRDAFPGLFDQPLLAHMLYQALPRSRVPFALHEGRYRPLRPDITSLLQLLGFYSAYGLGLAMSLFLLARRREQRRRLWVLVPAFPMAFLAAVPLLVQAIDDRPSDAEWTEVEYFAAGSTRGVAAGCLRIASAGKQTHDVTILGEGVAAYSAHGLPRFQHLADHRPLHLQPAGDGRARFAVGAPRWTQGLVRTWRDVAAPVAVRGNATVRGLEVDADVVLPAAWRGRPVFVVLQEANYQFRTEPVTPDGNGVVQGTFDFTKSRRSIGPYFGAHLVEFTPPGDTPRAFLVVLPADQSPAVASDDLRLAREISAEQARVRRAAMPLGHGVRLADGQHFHDRVLRVVVVEL